MCGRCDMKKFEDFNMHKEVMDLIHLCGFTTPTPIQEQVIFPLRACHCSTQSRASDAR